MDNLLKNAESYAAIVALITTLFGIVGGVISVIADLNQSGVSITLMTHKEKNKYKLHTYSVFTFSFALAVFVLLYSIKDILKDIAANNSISDNVIYIFVLGWMGLHVIISIVGVLTLINYRKSHYKGIDKEFAKQIIGKCSLLVYCVIMLCFFEIVQVLLLYGFDKNNYIYYCFVVIIPIFISLVSIYVIHLYVDRMKGERALIEWENEGRVCYLYETRENYILCGNKPFENECEYFELIPMDKVGQMRRVHKPNGNEPQAGKSKEEENNSDLDLTTEERNCDLVSDVEINKEDLEKVKSDLKKIKKCLKKQKKRIKIINKY